MRRFLPLGATLAMITALTGGVVLANDGKTVFTRGDLQLVPNAMIQSTLRFSPGPIIASSGETVTWTHADQTENPHTVTIVDQADLPTTVEQVFGCAVCGAALAGHFPNGAPVPVLNSGGDGLDAPGDSLLFFHGQSVSAEVTAPAGSTLYYLCSIHPWMQGSIRVQ